MAKIVCFRLLFVNDLQLQKLMKLIIDDGGEGVILRKKGSLYEHGTKSSSLIKMKNSQEDREGIVIEVNEGALTLKLADGNTINVPAERVQIEDATVGSVVSFSYDSNSRRALPVNVLVYRKRIDVNWFDVIATEENNSNKDEKGFATVPTNFWNEKTMRSFLEQFARGKGKDPSNRDTWYSMDVSEIYSDKKGKSIMKKLKGYSSAVAHLFPEFQFENNFMQAQFNDVKSRRKFFEDYARDNGFEALQPDNWYMQPREKMKLVKSAYAVIKYHKGSVSRALVELFPEIGFVKSKFTGSWSNAASRRDFFHNYANECGFDALNAESWYLESRGSILQKKVMAYHNNSLKSALLELFPEIGLDQSRIWSTSWSHGTKELSRVFPDFTSNRRAPSWYEPEASSRRSFFVKFAGKCNFDPLVARNWYSITKQSILTAKGGSRVLFYYKNNLSKALVDLFPDIGLDKSRFSRKHTLEET